MRSGFAVRSMGALAAILFTATGLAAQGQAPAGQAPAGQAPQPAPWPAAPIELTVAQGSRATYRVREQLVGINFPNDAVGISEDVTGAIVFAADGTLVPGRSKIVVDLRTLASDQDMRDGYVRGTNVLDTQKFPFVEFVPKRVVGLAWPFPPGNGGQAGFQLVGDMTVRGVTKETTWNVIATFGRGRVQGRAETAFNFETFSIPKPKIARLMSVDDTIKLEVELKMDPKFPQATGN